MHPEKLKVYISKLLLFNTLTSFTNFLHAPREAQSVHLKAFALRHLGILFKFSPCTTRSSKYTSQSFCSSIRCHPFANFIHAPREVQKYISKFLLFTTLTSFSNFLHVPREAQSIHLKAFALQYFDILLRIFSMHSEKLKVYISKLLLFNTLTSFSNFLHAPREAQSVHLKAFALQYFDILSNFLHALREAQSKHLKAFALRHFQILFEVSPCTSRSSKDTTQSFCSSRF